MLNYKELTLKLAACESEKELIGLLKDEGYWDKSICWRAFGDNENNWSTIGNQQSEADSALVEKLVNSIDAMLMKECLVRGINPESSLAPKSIASALEQYFGIKGGRLEDLTPSERTALAKSIILAASGEKPSKFAEKYPNITIVDKGEGQSPYRMPHTILSINKSNKLKVPFVQGKFNMGGTGVLRFCGENNIQLIISRRCPDINANEDKTHSLWGMTVIRRIRPGDGRRSSVYQYLTTDDKEIMSFDAPEGLPIIPTSKNINDVMSYGMYCKLFEYKMPSRLCSNINMNLYSRLSTLLPNLAYPIYLDECRDYNAHTKFRTLSGLNVRLSDQTQSDIEESNIEEILSAKFTIAGQELSAIIYVFKKINAKGKEVDPTQFRADEGIILTQNGQTHGSFDRKFYRRNNVGLSYLSESLLTIVDCSNIDEATREDLFMNSRDRMSSGGFSAKLEHELEDYFKNNDTLKRIQDRRRQEALANKLDDEKPLEEILNSVFKSSSVLSKLFMSGERLKNPSSLGAAPEEEDFNGQYNPTYFSLIAKKSGEYKKEAQLNRKCMIKFKTDAVNNFFSREDYPGEYSLFCNGEKCDNHNMNLHNGYATLSIELPPTAKIGDELSFKCIITAPSSYVEFENSFTLKIIEFQESTGGGGRRLQPNGEGPDGNSFSPTGLALPNVIEVTQDDWNTHNFTKTSALNIMKVNAESNVYDFYINMDNIHLLTELKSVAKDLEKVKLYKARYKYALVLMGLSALGYYANKDNTNEETQRSEVEIEGVVKLCTEILSPVILPMIEVMGGNVLDILEN